MINNLERKYWIVLIILFSVFSCTKNKKINENETKLLIYYHELDSFVNIYPDSAMKMIPKLIKSLKNSKTNTETGIINSSIAEVYRNNYEYLKADSFNELSLKIFEKEKQKKLLAMAWNQKGQINENLTNNPKAIECFDNSLNIAIELKDLDLIRSIYANLAYIFNFQKKPERAIEYIQLAFDSTEKKLNSTQKAKNYRLLAAAYSIMNKPDSAEFFYKKSIHMFESLNNSYYAAWVKSEYAQLFVSNDLSKMLSIYLECHNIFKKVALNSQVSITNLNNIGITYYMITMEENPLSKKALIELNLSKDSALKYAENYLLMAQRIVEKQGRAYDMYFSYGNMSVVKAGKKDFENAYLFLSKCMENYTQHYSQENSNKIAAIEYKNELQELENTIKNKRLMNSVLVLIIVTILGFVFFTFKFFQKKQRLKNLQIKSLEDERKIEATKYLIEGEEKERERLAQEIHDGVSGTLSGIKMSFMNIKENLIIDSENATNFEKQIRFLDKSISELRNISHNLIPENLYRLGLINAIQEYATERCISAHIKLTFENFMTITIASKSLQLNIYRVLQELISNAIKHAQCSSLIVQLSNTNNKILITIEDNGVGINPTINTNGIGLHNVQHRIEFLNGRISFNSDKQGTSINIELPIYGN